MCRSVKGKVLFFGILCSSLFFLFADDDVSVHVAHLQSYYISNPLVHISTTAYHIAQQLPAAGRAGPTKNTGSSLHIPLP